MAALAPKKQAARIEVLTEVVRLGGNATWSQLHSRGLHYMSVSAAALRGDLREVTSYHYAITDAGRAALERSEG